MYEEFSNSSKFVIMSEEGFAVFTGSFENCLNFLINARTLQKNTDLSITIQHITKGSGFNVTGRVDDKYITYSLIPSPDNLDLQEDFMDPTSPKKESSKKDE